MYPNTQNNPKLIVTQEPTKTHKRKARGDEKLNKTNTNKNSDLEP
jgi:hypothetical protein